MLSFSINGMSFQEINRNAILEDEHEQRLRRIKLIERETAEQAPLWQAKQATLFPQALPLSQVPSLGQMSLVIQTLSS